MIPKKDVTCKNRQDRKKSVLPVFSYKSENEKCTEKEQKKSEKYVKNSLHFRGQNAILLRDFLRVDFLTHKKPHPKSLQQKIPYTRGIGTRKEVHHG